MSSPEQPTFSHSGQRYLLGYTSVEYGIWDRQAPGGPVQRYPKSDQGWTDAWGAYQALETPAAAPAPAPSEAPRVAAPSETPAVAAPTTPPASAATVQLPAAAPRPPFRVTARLVAQVLRVAGWALLGLLPIQGIALLASGGTNFYGIMTALSNFALGPAFWGICTALATRIEKD